MQTSLLIDSIVRQTTVLIAQLSTTSGLRAPLAHVANQVFLDLVTELEAQGVGRKVIADMFGLALRSYQQKVQRLQESATDRGTTLWEAVLAFVVERETATRAEVLERFSQDDGATVRGVLNDLVGSSLVYRTGGGDTTVYRAAQSAELPGTSNQAHQAVFDHFQAVVGAISAKLALNGAGKGQPSPVGGRTFTFTFDVWPSHPLHEQAQSLLERTRQDAAKLSDAVQAYNAAHARPPEQDQVTLYLGQNSRPDAT